MKNFDIVKAAMGVVYDETERFWTGKWNLLDEVQSQLQLPENVTFLDTTLREGGELPLVYYTVNQKIEIARALEEAGVSEIDCGFVSLSKDHFETLKVIKNAGLRIKTVALTRLDAGNPESAIDFVVEAGADVVLTCIYGVPIPGFRTEEDYVNLIRESVRYTKNKGVFCSFWVPNQRWEPVFAEDLYKAAIQGGADRIEVAGSNCNGPTAFRVMVKRLKKIAGEKQVGLHCHNTMGTGTACALIGIEAGAEVVHTSINGMSDGGGIAAFEEVVMALITQYRFFNLGIKLEKLRELSVMMRNITKHPLSPWKPIVGDTVFTETSDSHLERNIAGRKTGVTEEENKAAWSVWGFMPETVGQKVKIIFGPSGLVGRGINAKADEMGLELDDKALERIKEVMKERFSERGGLTEEEMKILIQECVAEAANH